MKTICIDIDGTISHFIEWVDSKTFGDVLPDCAQTIHHLKADGWHVIIYTTRADKAEITKFLNANNIPFDSINENPFQPDNAKGGKPFADVYLDDRAICFDGNWKAVYDKIKSFKPWENMERPLNEISEDYCKDIMVTDFVQSMETHRHYDRINWDITKFTFGQVLVAIGACWTVYTFQSSEGTNKWMFIFYICLASFLFCLISLYTLLKNRTYFTRISRHINEIRNQVISTHPFGFSNEANFWSNPKYPKVKDYKSTQFIAIYMVSSLIIALSIALSFFTCKFFCCSITFFKIAIPTIVVIVGIILMVGMVAKEDFNK